MPVTPRLRSATSCTLVGIVLVLSAAILAGCVATPSPVSSVDYSPKAGIAPLAVVLLRERQRPGDPRDLGLRGRDHGIGHPGRARVRRPRRVSAEVRWTVPGGASGNRSGLRVAVYDPQNLPGNYSVGTLSPADMRYLSTLKQKIDLFDQYYIEFAYLNKSHATAMRYTSRDFQFAMKQSLSQPRHHRDVPRARPGAGVGAGALHERDRRRVRRVPGRDQPREGRTSKRRTPSLALAWPKMEVAKAERDRLVQMLEVVQ